MKRFILPADCVLYKIENEKDAWDFLPDDYVDIDETMLVDIGDYVLVRHGEGVAVAKMIEGLPIIGRVMGCGRDVTQEAMKLHDAEIKRRMATINCQEVAV